MSDTLFDMSDPNCGRCGRVLLGNGQCAWCDMTIASAEAAADDAIKRGSKAADPAWVTAANDVMWERYRTGREFTTDEVMIALEELGVETHDSRALGGVVRRFLNKGLIREVGTTKSRRRHGARIPVYVGTSSHQTGGTPKKEHHAHLSSTPVPTPTPHGTYTACPGCDRQVDSGYYSICIHCGERLR